MQTLRQGFQEQYLTPELVADVLRSASPEEAVRGLLERHRAWVGSVATTQHPMTSVTSHQRCDGRPTRPQRACQRHEACHLTGDASCYAGRSLSSMRSLRRSS